MAGRVGAVLLALLLLPVTPWAAEDTLEPTADDPAPAAAAPQDPAAEPPVAVPQDPAPGSGPASVEGPPVTASAFPVAQADEEDGHWTLQESLGLPSWFDLRFEQRTRFEKLDGDLRVGPFKDDNQGWVIRNLIQASVRGERWRLTGEVQDARIYSEPGTGFINTAIVNTVEPLQFYVGHTSEGLFSEGDRFDLKVGRQTIDFGSRRLVARNGFRNTINGYTGVTGTWDSAEGERIHALAVVPQRRLPLRPDELRDNERALDDEEERTRLYGLLHAQPVGERSLREWYVLGMDERDSGDVFTADRQLVTFGGRYFTPPAPGAGSFEWESIFQVGESRRTPLAVDTADLTHRAHAHHVSIGYMWDGEQRPHLQFQFDYASGDRSSTDSSNERFDELFGAAGKDDLGPTSLFAGYIRANIISPAVRLTTSPFDDGELELTARQGWLASRKDSFAATGLIDPAGDSGRNVGQQIDARLRIHKGPGEFMWEFGAAHLFAGSFIEDAPNNTGQGDSTYVYGGFRMRF